MSRMSVHSTQAKGGMIITDKCPYCKGRLKEVEHRDRPNQIFAVNKYVCEDCGRETFKAI